MGWVSFPDICRFSPCRQEVHRLIPRLWTDRPSCRCSGVCNRWASTSAWLTRSMASQRSDLCQDRPAIKSPSPSSLVTTTTASLCVFSRFHVPADSSLGGNKQWQTARPRATPFLGREGTPWPGVESGFFSRPSATEELPMNPSAIHWKCGQMKSTETYEAYMPPNHVGNHELIVMVLFCNDPMATSTNSQGSRQPSGSNS